VVLDDQPELGGGEVMSGHDVSGDEAQHVVVTQGHTVVDSTLSTPRSLGPGGEDLDGDVLTLVDPPPYGTKPALT